MHKERISKQVLKQSDNKTGSKCIAYVGVDLLMFMLWTVVYKGIFILFKTLEFSLQNIEMQI